MMRLAMWNGRWRISPASIMLEINLALSVRFAKSVTRIQGAPVKLSESYGDDRVDNDKTTKMISLWVDY